MAIRDGPRSRPVAAARPELPLPLLLPLLLTVLMGAGACPSKPTTEPPTKDPAAAPGPGAGASWKASDQDLPGIVARGRLRALFAPSADKALGDPFSLLMVQKETLARFAERRGLELQLRPAASQEQALEALERHEADLVLDVGHSKGLDARFHFTPPVGKRTVESPLAEVSPGEEEPPATQAVAWALPKQAPLLAAALDAFVTEQSLTGHTRERFQGDLKGMRTRGVLRVLTRNNPVTYFLYKGAPRGFDYRLCELLAKGLGLRLEMVVVPSRELLIPWLLEGRGDLIAASFSVTPKRAQRVAFSRPYLYVDEILVQAKDAKPIESLAQLAGRTVHLRPSSSYWDTLRRLAPKAQLVPVDETLETETLIDQVGRGVIPLTVADSHILAAELTWRDDVRAGLDLSRVDPDHQEGDNAIAFAMRKASPKLKQQVDKLVAQLYRGLDYNLARKRYFQSPKRIRAAKVWRDQAEAAGRLSPYDQLFRREAARYGFDWRLMAAMAFQESHFDPKATSWVGAEGLFQVMPATGRELGFKNLHQPEQGVAAGMLYLHQLIGRFDASLPFRQRVRMAMAAYNAGLGHVFDARRLARARGLDPNRWFANVSKAMLLLEKPRFHRHSRHGYVRGREPVNYVSQIQNRYDNYVKLAAE